METVSTDDDSGKGAPSGDAWCEDFPEAPTFEGEPSDGEGPSGDDCDGMPPRHALLRELAAAAAACEEVSEFPQYRPDHINAARDAFRMGWAMAGDARTGDVSLVTMARAVRCATEAIQSWFADSDDARSRLPTAAPALQRARRGALSGAWERIVGTARAFRLAPELAPHRAPAAIVMGFAALGVPWRDIGLLADNPRAARALYMFDCYAGGDAARRAWDDAALAADVLRFLGHDPRRFTVAARVARHRNEAASGKASQRKAPRARRRRAPDTQ